MKRAIHLAILATAFTSVSAFAHHMAEDMVSPETYEMITSNLEAADSPHLDLDLASIPSRMNDGSTTRTRSSDSRLLPPGRPGRNR